MFMFVFSWGFFWKFFVVWGRLLYFEYKGDRNVVEKTNGFLKICSTPIFIYTVESENIDEIAEGQ